MESEKFCLRWNNFQSNISSAFRKLRNDNDFFDVTLSCDNEQIQAHFRDILRRNPHQHPLLYLRGVRFCDLQSVLNFMYHGEVNVAQDELNSFRMFVEDLRIKGLTQKISEPMRKENTPPQNLPPSSNTLQDL
jgi:broad-like protein